MYPLAHAANLHGLHGQSRGGRNASLPAFTTLLACESAIYLILNRCFNHKQFARAIVCLKLVFFLLPPCPPRIRSRFCAGMLHFPWVGASLLLEDVLA